MRVAVIHAPGDILDTLAGPKVLEPTDAIIRTAVTCVWLGHVAVSHCGAD